MHDSLLVSVLSVKRVDRRALFLAGSGANRSDRRRCVAVSPRVLRCPSEKISRFPRLVGQCTANGCTRPCPLGPDAEVSRGQRRPLRESAKVALYEAGWPRQVATRSLPLRAGAPL